MEQGGIFPFNPDMDSADFRFRSSAGHPFRAGNLFQSGSRYNTDSEDSDFWNAYFGREYKTSDWRYWTGSSGMGSRGVPTESHSFAPHPGVVHIPAEGRWCPVFAHVWCKTCLLHGEFSAALLYSQKNARGKAALSIFEKGTRFGHLYVGPILGPLG